MTTQLAFNIDLEPSYAEKDFVIGDCNREAQMWVQKWPQWPTNALIIYGPSGAGKTHLGAIWQNQSQALSISGQALSSQQLESFLSKYNTFLIDDADQVKDQESFFHLCNHVKNTQGSLLLLAQHAPNLWRMSLPDLRSRLNAMNSVALDNPDDHVLAALYSKLFSDQQIQVPVNVVRYLTTHGERSYAGAKKVAHDLNELALREKRPITLPLARQLLQQESYQ